MHPDMHKLWALQVLDVEAKRLRDEMTALPKHVAQLDARAKATVGQRAVVIELIAKEEALRRGQESDVKDRQSKIARIRKQMDTATNMVQVQAWEHEIVFGQGEIAKLEDSELESMERSEALDAQKRLADEAVDAAAKKHASERERAIATIATDKTALAEVEVKRTEQRKTIDETALSNYDRIARGKGTAVAEALNQKCSACQMMVRPQRWNDLRERDNHDMMSCESCGRMLYYDPARDSPTRKVMEVESIAAQIVRHG